MALSPDGTGGPPGGFIHPSLPSPAPSSFSTSTATPSSLPRQRAHPLKAGSIKETALINHIDKSILTVNRRHAKKFSSAIGEQDIPEAERGYESFKEVVKDLEAIIDIVWVSGTPSLQIPYLISLAGLVNSYLPEYPFSPRSTFRLIKKLDAIFASLLTGEDADTGAPISGFENRRNVVSMTEKVRIKSLAEACRIAVVEARDREDSRVTEEEEADGMDVDGTGDENENEDEDVYGTDDYVDAPDRWEMEGARVYERTIQLLGDELGKQGGL
ncbi:hypothetical protein C8Q69DRAFT_476912 [Paecilomyces variotii]|uniref:Meiotic recombination protein DMC1 n=1 Tax=Byssochlamys spectabilis TaxID=264951 RepID=A0A443HME6_BYSSP|nr:hypothetical protein C8Q69DRAFT_476912 [Paecilomyces variotii]KAJ9305554.1 hypothetical protein DTO217A2_4953 [Paecilomyces variotii]KAJ9350166.1 hypothetical protein DTO280E4_8744 [Paecilomyces variotii]RWQ92971.1 hypothetical protein C8Q69DRAFT_476912 [Paecilomyces variotii]